MHNHGLTPKDIDRIKRAISKHKEIQNATIYGSRALGTYKPGSDIDIAIYGKSITSQTTLNLSTTLNQHTTMPYHFDITHYESITNPNLKTHIDQHSITLT